jgi:hypothetical protein
LNNFVNFTKVSNSVEVKSSKASQNLSKSSIIFINGLKNLQKFNKLTNLSNFYPKKLKFLIIAENLSLSDILKIPVGNLSHDLEGHLSQFEYFLTSTKKEFQISTVEWFSEFSCGKAHLKILNVFDKKKFKWKNLLKFEEKFESFYGCQIVEMKANHEVVSVVDENTGNFKGKKIFLIIFNEIKILN